MASIDRVHRQWMCFGSHTGKLRSVSESLVPSSVPVMNSMSNSWHFARTWFCFPEQTSVNMFSACMQASDAMSEPTEGLKVFYETWPSSELTDCKRLLRKKWKSQLPLAYVLFRCATKRPAFILETSERPQQNTGAFVFGHDTHCSPGTEQTGVVIWFWYWPPVQKILDSSLSWLTLRSWWEAVVHWVFWTLFMSIACLKNFVFACSKCLFQLWFATFRKRRSWGATCSLGDDAVPCLPFISHKCAAGRDSPHVCWR